VRLARPEDIPAIRAIESIPDYARLVGRWSAEEHLAELARPGSRTFVDGDEVAGFAIVQRLDDPHGRAHLKRIAVRAPGTGAGTRLLAQVTDWVFDRTDANRLDLDVFVGNDRARRAYEKSGFTLEGLLREYVRVGDGTYRDVWLMSVLRRERR
jgi:diamine N-acetyltransferase